MAKMLNLELVWASQSFTKEINLRFLIGILDLSKVFKSAQANGVHHSHIHSPGKQSLHKHMQHSAQADGGPFFSIQPARKPFHSSSHWNYQTILLY